MFIIIIVKPTSRPTKPQAGKLGWTYFIIIIIFYTPGSIDARG